MNVRMRQYCVYIMASQKNGTLYTGVTSNLLLRVAQHKTGTFKGFSSEFYVDRLAYYEVFDDPRLAIEREKTLKKWKREWKIKLIEQGNPKWDDLAGKQL